MRAELRDRALERASAVLDPVSRDAKLLDLIAWPRKVESEFFASGFEKLPSPVYSIDRGQAEKHVDALKSLSKELAGDHVLYRWLRSICESYIASNTMLLAVGTKAFYKHSVAVYGGAATTALDADTSNLDFAEHVARRLGDAPPPLAPESERMTTDEFIADMARRLAKRTPVLSVEIVPDEHLTAKAICGATRLRVRAGATFDRVEARGLFHHEIETHALTAQNGAAQPRLPFLRGGGPRTTRTQEGLAVFSELYNHALSTDRLRRLVERVRLVGMAEDGATFIDLFRHLVDNGLPEHSAYLDAQRICRGGLVGGGAPFTKDACYLSGLMDVYNFLRVALRSGAGHVPRLLVSGRMALEDIEALDWLRREGVLADPVHLPHWVKRWDELLAYFAFTSFLNEVDLEPIERRHRALLRGTS